MSSSTDPALRRGHTFWLFGFSGAGKSTLGNALTRELRSRGTPVLGLDGDWVRGGLCQGLGFSDTDRTENLRRAAEVAKLANESGLHVVAAFITPLDLHRQLVTQILNPENLSLIFIDASLDECRRRDVKGLYAHADAGKIKSMTGLSSDFAPPRAPQLTIESGAEAVSVSTAKIVAYALNRLSSAPPVPRRDS